MKRALLETISSGFSPSKIPIYRYLARGFPSSHEDLFPLVTKCQLQIQHSRKLHKADSLSQHRMDPQHQELGQ